MTRLLSHFILGTYRSIFRSSESHRLKYIKAPTKRKIRKRTVKSTISEAFMGSWDASTDEESTDEFESDDGTSVE